MSSSAAEDKALSQLFDRMIPTLKRAILRDSERRPEALSLEIVLLSSIVQLRKELAQP
jgi:hypothetical protein